MWLHFRNVTTPESSWDWHNAISHCPYWKYPVTFPKRCHTSGLGIFSGDLWDLWHMMCDVTCDVPCHIYYSPIVILGCWHLQNVVTQGSRAVFWWSVTFVTFLTFLTCDVWCVTCNGTLYLSHIPHLDTLWKFQPNW